MKRGQLTLDYILLIGVVAAGIIAMLIYAGRGHQGNLRSQAEQLGAGQYAPGNTTIPDNRQIKKLESVTRIFSSTTVERGNLNEPNLALIAKLKEIDAKWAEIYTLKKAWELLAVSEAQAGAAAVRSGNFGWTPPVPGLKEKGVEINNAYLALNILNVAAQQLAEDWPERTKDKTFPAESTNIEEGESTTDKYTSETLGDL